MTVLMSFVGCIVFVFSIFTVGFASAFKRLWMFALTGLAIDTFIIGIAVLVTLSLHY